MRPARSPLGIVVLALALAACAGEGTDLDENGIPLGETGPSDSGVTLSKQVQPILNLNCALSGCHAGSSPAQEMNLSSDLTHSNVVNVPSLQLPRMNRVTPFQPDASYLLYKIRGTHIQIGGSGSRMPLGRDSLSLSEQNLIRVWIAAGAKNN